MVARTEIERLDLLEELCTKQIVAWHYILERLKAIAADNSNPKLAGYAAQVYEERLKQINDTPYRADDPHHEPNGVSLKDWCLKWVMALHLKWHYSERLKSMTANPSTPVSARSS